MDAAQATQVVHDLQSQVVHHKSEIRRHRNELRWKADRLAKFERECQRLGIKVITATTNAGVEGDLHGRDHSKA